MSICFRKWFFSRASDFVDIGYSFAGFGTLIIEGDSLLNYISADSQSGINRNLTKFFNNLNECNLEDYRIVFFSQKSKQLSDHLVEIFLRLEVKVDILSDWNDKEWTHFLAENNISLFLVSKVDIFKELGAQFDLMHQICVKNRIQAALIDDLRFQNMNVFASIVMGEKVADIALDKYQKIAPEPSFSIKKDTNFIKIYKINNHHVTDLLEYNHNDLNNNPMSLISAEFTKYDRSFNWELKIHYNPQTNNEDAQKMLKNNQKYYRYMEIYASSLDSSKNLHHKLVTQINDPTDSKTSIKINKKALDLINQNLETKKNIKESKELELLKNIKISCYDDIDKNLMMTKTDQFSSNSLLELQKLKIKWLNYEPNNTDKKMNTLILIDQLSENNLSRLSESEVFNLLNLLKNQGFESLCHYYANQILSQNDWEKLKKFCQDLKNTFNHDALFQLKYCGQYLPRTLDSMDDPRVCFKPDRWQKDLLDIVDRNESALICCPTSSGKTFISYYAMEKILRQSHQDVVVFLAPIKALANQVAAEVYARFSKVYPKTFEKSVYAMSMPDYAINNPLNCQILITVPACFESMICDNSNAEWVKLVKYVILDEVQTVNDPGMAESIEKIIHMVDCPVLILSATIGNLDHFFLWLKDIHESKGLKINKIVHKERFCDLKKFLFVPKKKVEKPLLLTVHELFGYSKEKFLENSLSQDFHLMAPEIVEILSSLQKICSVNEEKKQLFKTILPNKFLNCVKLKKKDVKDYENFLVTRLQSWFTSGALTKSEIENFFSDINKQCEEKGSLIDQDANSPNWLVKNIPDLINLLHKSKMLPAIIFVNSCDGCDQMALALTEYLINLEKSDKSFMEAVENEEKVVKNMKKKRSKCSGEQDQQEEEECEIPPLIDRSKYSFLDPKYQMANSEIESEIKMHRYRNIPKIFFEAWKRGIGVHHANYHTKFRSSVECLFRKKHLQVVFATETLSLGINMPCKTVVIPSDLCYLNPIYYRHMVGRAGRRGFDTIGNIVFFGVPKNKIKNFIASKTSNIRGSFSLNLKLITQFSSMQFYDPKAMKIFESFLKNPIARLSSNYELKKAQKSVYIKIQYLMTKAYIDSNFNPKIHKVRCLILLRNENLASIDLMDFILSASFDKLVLNKEMEDMCDLMCIILSHFLKIRIFSQEQAAALSLIILPEIGELKNYLINKENEIADFVQSFLNDQDDIEYFLRGFSNSLQNVLMKKNSYIYDFYRNGNLEKIEEINKLS
ncbi:superfamily II RNA helicase [Brachionus plicatilis]|uniref:Superfamily II RNA helicase n=1 Tax=Brachionus plicatilis TaxID=10195 RepID=A0A3M7R2M0_BRAPC|nr:superfamily II RNA helicase [Brachionus plicatilis]